MTALLTIAWLATLAFVPMTVEAARSRANERRLRASGAVEPAGDVYRWMQVAYPACFLAMVCEAWIRRVQFLHWTFAAGLAVFVAAKLLKYWAIATLGPRWTFRVLVPPRSQLSTGGPYRFMRHPNYVGVAGELIGMALMAQAGVTGPVALVVFGALLLARVRVEQRALAEAG